MTAVICRALSVSVLYTDQAHVLYIDNPRPKIICECVLTSADGCEIVNPSSETTLFNNLALSFLCVSMRLALNNPVRRLVAHSDMKAITSGNRMSLTGCNGLGIVSVKSNRLVFFNNLVGSV